MAKFTKNTTRFVIFDSARNIDFEEVKEFCEINDMETPEENSSAYWDIVNHIREFDIEDFWANLKYSKLNYTSVMVTGTMGLWNGRPEIVPTLVCGIDEAIRKMCNSDIMDIKVEYDCGVINVYASHHDGTNCFEIHKLSKAGIIEVDRPKYYYEDYEPKDWWFKQFSVEEIGI